MSAKNAYAILNVNKDATDEEVKAAYIEMVKKYDPEKHTERFMQIQKAHKALMDPAERAKMDLTIFTPVRGEFTFADDERAEIELSQASNDVATSKQAADADPQNGEARARYFRALMRRSFVHMRSKTWTEAIADWTNVLRLDPTHLRARNNLLFAYIGLGYQYSQHGLFEEAMDLWIRAMKMNPDNVSTMQNLALAAEKANDTEKAKKYWSEVTKRWKQQLDENPQDAYLKTSIIEVHKKLGDQALTSGGERDSVAAAESYRQILSINPNDFDAKFQIAHTLMEGHKWTESITELTALSREHPNNIEVLNLMGWAYINAGQHDLAFKTWQRSFQIDPKSTATRDNIIRARLEVGKKMREKGIYMKSIVHFKELLKFLPTSPEVHYEIGVTYLEMGDRRSAVASFNTVLKLDPKNKSARKAISDLRLTE